MRMSDEQQAKAARISDEQRNGSIGAIAIVLGFSLTFTAEWTQGDEAWSARALVVLAVAAFGIVNQLRALLGMFSLPVVSLAEHQRITARFRWGVSTVLAGYALQIVWDAIQDLVRSLH